MAGSVNNADSWSSASSPESNSFTVSGTMLVAIIFAEGGNESVTSVTQNGVALEQLEVYAYTGYTDTTAYVFKLKNPPTGANSFVVTFDADAVGIAVWDISGIPTRNGILDSGYYATGSSTYSDVDVSSEEDGLSFSAIYAPDLISTASATGDQNIDSYVAGEIYMGHVVSPDSYQDEHQWYWAGSAYKWMYAFSMAVTPEPIEFDATGFGGGF